MLTGLILLLITFREKHEQERQKIFAEQIARDEAEKQSRSARQAESGFRARSLIEKEALVALCNLTGNETPIAVDEVKELVETLLVSLQEINSSMLTIYRKKHLMLF